MPEIASRHIGIAADMFGCPNRCRHCYLGNGPNGRLPAEVLREVAGAFWHWGGPGEGAGRFQQVDVASWYREPDFADNYRDLYNPTDAKARWIKLACAG